MVGCGREVKMPELHAQVPGFQFHVWLSIHCLLMWTSRGSRWQLIWVPATQGEGPGWVLFSVLREQNCLWSHMKFSVPPAVAEQAKQQLSFFFFFNHWVVKVLNFVQVDNYDFVELWMWSLHLFLLSFSCLPLNDLLIGHLDLKELGIFNNV